MARRSSAGCGTFCRSECDGAVIEREARIPDERGQGSRRARRVRHEDPDRVRRARAVPALLQPRAGDHRRRCTRASGALVSAHQSIGVPQPLKMFGIAGAEAGVPAPLRQRGDQRVPAHRAGRRLRPGAAGHHRDAAGRRAGYVLDGVKLWTTNGVVAELLVVMARVPESEGAAAASPRSWWRPTRRASPWSTATPSWACAASRTASPGSTRCGCRRDERDRQGRQGPQDRADHAEHRPAVAARDVRRRGQVVAEDRPRVGRGAGAVGPAGRRARGGRPQDRLHRRHHVRDGGRARPVRRTWPTTAATTSGSRPRWPSCAPARWPGWSPTSWSRSAAAAATRPPSRWPRAASAPSRPSRSCATCGSTGSSRAPPRSCTC